MISIRLHDAEQLEKSAYARRLPVPYAAARGTSQRAAERWCARLALSEHLSAQGATVGAAHPEKFETTVLGAPYLAQSSHHMGVSHTGKHIATVVYDKSTVAGIDIECVARDVGGTNKLDEQDLCSTGPSCGQFLPPVALFCAREAAGKALGIGLLAAWDVYDPSSVRDVSQGDAPLWRVDYSSLPFLACYIAIVDSTLVLACAVAKRADEYIVRQAFADLEDVRLGQ